MTTAQLSMSTALFVSGRGTRTELTALLRDAGFRPVPVDDTDAIGSGESVTLCVVDLCQNGDALRVARAVRQQHPRATVIGIADPGRPSAASDAMRAGVFDVLPRPATARDLEALVANAREQTALAAAGGTVDRASTASYGIIGASPAMRLVMELVQRAAKGRCGILVVGERGTGREAIARAIHAYSANPSAPFVKIDAAGPTPDEIELLLFGGINRRAAGGGVERRSLERLGGHSRIRDAAGGVLFIEQVAELPARVQARLLRVLRDREVFIDASRDPVSLDVRPIVAVDSTIEAAVDEGRLRRDLFERLSLVRIDVPALRQRREDIPALASHFLKELCRANGVPMKTLSRAALTLLAALPWRSNAPELRGLLERLILLVPHGLIRLEDVLAHTQIEGTINPTGFDATLRQARASFERDYIAAVLQHQHGRIADAARVLGVQRTNLYRKMRRLNLMRSKTSAKGV